MGSETVTHDALHLLLLLVHYWSLKAAFLLAEGNVVSTAHEVFVFMTITHDFFLVESVLLIGVLWC